jgi:hypothetical protein
MTFLRRVFRGGERRPEAGAASVGGETARVSPNRYWRCPDCGGVQGKAELDARFLPGAAITGEGMVACRKCGREHPEAAVYGGRYDFTGALEAASRVQLAQRYLEAEAAQKGDDLEALLAPDAVMVTMRGELAGAKAIADRLRYPSGPGSGMMGRLVWGTPVQEGDVVRVTGKPSMPNAPFPGLTLTLAFDESDRIRRIELGRVG